MHDFKVGERVYWTDPGEDLASGWGVIEHVQSEYDDAVIAVRKDDGGSAEVFPHELSKEKPC